MKKLIPLLLMLLASTQLFSQENLLQNAYSRDGSTLNGRWNYILDPYESGFYNYRREPHDQSENPGAGAYFLNSKPKDETDRVEYDFDVAPTLVVPGDWNSQKENLLYYEGTLWYKKSFDIPDFDAKKRYYLHFGAVNYFADVYVNGKKLGTHRGGFTPFNFEMTELLKAKDNFVIVRVDNKRAADEVPTVSTDWWNYGGITRGVTIYELSQTFIEDYNLQLDTKNPSLLTGSLQLNGPAKADTRVEISIPGLKIKKSVTTDAEGFATIEIPAKKLVRWTTTNPKRYAVTLSTDSDEISDTIGFRNIATKGSDILLNKDKIFLKGISIHEENVMRGGRAYSMEDARVLLGWAKELGCNFVRLAHYPHNENMVRLADELGLLVWEEIPVYWTIDWENSKTYNRAETQLKEVIARDKNRASVIIWSMANETPQSDARLKFLTDLANTTKSLDSTRLITAALEDHPSEGNKDKMVIEDKFAEVVDIVSFNQYYGWYGGAIENLKNIRWEIDIDKPVIISEFGAAALQGNHGNKTEMWTEENQEYLYEETLPTLAKIPQLSGMTPWILTDFRSPRRMHDVYQNGYNRKGLISETGDKKKAFYTLQDFYDGFGNEP
ncbi:beta-glucuronidase [Aggregatimonas sangjinii]|uniref:Beta-glucuronidase n=1 Tax=Aggregatimonas sangjinii TaxID=2583587 RepID=A0A5B7SUZ2_9FLAO|nr:glycoside hydrolase family 2 TIM barrel-domain containing protein [Aggregatimonas sangjinii]QCX00983.1 beta-glucuronidase [Aggregatimonas sangjinii]